MRRGCCKYHFGVLGALLFLLGCNQQNTINDETVAQVGQKQLLFSEVSEVVPNDVTGNDSAVIAEDYINKWIKKQLLVQKAEENLSFDQKNLNKELEEYRNSLIIYR
ncbi:MAG TPA: hypothetical protein VKA10_01750, partial [Prolixibacteraceae bacterium]|nr:hypothetical protein [Prolixibacteraceae bacterium]